MRSTHFENHSSPRPRPCPRCAQGIAFVGPAVCMLACAVLTPASAATAKAAAEGTAVASPALTAVLVGLMSIAFAFGAWSRAGLYCNHQVRFESGLKRCILSMAWP